MNPKNLFLFFLSILFTILLMGYKPNEGLIFGWPPTIFSCFAIFSLTLMASGLIYVSTWILRIPKKIRLYFCGIPIAFIMTFILWIQIDFYRNSSGQIYSLTPILKPGNFESIFYSSLVVCTGFVIFFGRSAPSKVKAFFAFGSVFVGFSLFSAFLTNDLKYPDVKSNGKKPNIIILSFDSLQDSLVQNAENFPFLNSIRDEFLVANNFYSNSCCTHGSIATLYTGSTPLRTRVAYPPSRLEGKFVTYNMPMALRLIGYTTNSFTTDYWANARELGISTSFDSISATRKGLLENSLALSLFGEAGPIVKPFTRFVTEIANRVNKFYFGENKNFSAFAEVTDPTIKGQGDDDKLQYIVDLIRRMSTPQFVHAHFMSLHAIDGNSAIIPTIVHSFDSKIELIYKELEKSKSLENTMLIVTSDHGILWNSATTIPLWIRFPDRAKTGSFNYLAQMADLAPTILNYLRVTHDIPFEGIDLFSLSNENKRSIYSISDVQAEAPVEAPNFKMNGLWEISLTETKKIPLSQFKLRDDGTISVK